MESTVAAGIPYFTLSWRNPTPQQRDWDLDTYAAACLEAIRVACDIAGSDDANVAGVCAGGVTLAALLGHLAATGESSLVNSVTFLVAGLDTTTETTASNLMSAHAVEVPGAIAAAACSAARTWPRSSPGCDRMTSCGTTGSSAVTVSAMDNAMSYSLQVFRTLQRRR